MARYIGGVPTKRVAVDLSLLQVESLRAAAQRIGTNMSDVLKRALDALLLPDRPKGERLCICNGDRKVSDIAGL